MDKKCQIIPDSTGKGFDGITAIYDVLVALFSFNRINKSQLAFLSHLSGQKTGLILGGGTGYFLQKMLEQNDAICITYVDASEKMIAKARERIKNNLPEALHRVSFMCINVEDFVRRDFDVIICNYFLDLFEDNYVQELASIFQKHLKPEGLLYVTDFNVTNKNLFLKRSTELGLRILYYFFRLTVQLHTKKLPEIEQHLKNQGFILFRSKRFLSGILLCNLYKNNLE